MPEVSAAGRNPERTFEYEDSHVHLQLLNSALYSRCRHRAFSPSTPNNAIGDVESDSQGKAWTRSAQVLSCRLGQAENQLTLDGMAFAKLRHLGNGQLARLRDNCGLQGSMGHSCHPF